MGIVEFLTARYDDIERVAQKARWTRHMDCERWRAVQRDKQYGRGTWFVEDDYDEGVADILGQAADPEGIAHHVALHDPVSVLLDLKAKRLIVVECAETEAAFDSYENGPAVGLAECVLKLLAAQFAAHPDYNPAWTLPELIEEGRAD